MLMHNNANGSFTEFCQAHDTVFGGITAVQYLISDVTSHVSFHGSGLLRAAIQGSRKCVASLFIGLLSPLPPPATPPRPPPPPPPRLLPLPPLLLRLLRLRCWPVTLLGL